MALDRFVQRLPELNIFNRFFVGGFPAIAFPAMDPLGDAVFHILGVHMHLNITSTLQSIQRLYGRFQLHAVIGALWLAAINFFARAVIVQNSTPAAGAGIARTSTIGVNDNFTFAHRAGWAGRSSRGNLNDTFSSRKTTFSTDTS